MAVGMPEAIDTALLWTVGNVGSLPIAVIVLTADSSPHSGDAVVILARQRRGPPVETDPRRRTHARCAGSVHGQPQAHPVVQRADDPISTGLCEALRERRAGATHRRMKAHRAAGDDDVVRLAARPPERHLRAT